MKTRSTPIKHLSRAAMAGFVLSATPLHADTLLFLDTFNRPNSTDLNASTAGKSGSLGALTWTGVTTLFGATSNIVDINNNRLRMDPVASNGADGCLAYISDHNFTDASIKTAGSFTVSVDIPTGSSSGDGRHMGFGIGSSLAELVAVTSASPTANPSDVYFAYDIIGTTKGFRVYHNGAGQGTGLSAFPAGTGVLPDTITGKFTFVDMNAGTTLNYEFFIDGISVVTGSTVWSGTDENYICLESNYTNASTFDNFQVSVPGPPLLLTKNPADGAINIAPSQDLVATFDEPIFLNTTGSITIKNLTTLADTVISLPGPDPDGDLSVVGNVLTLVPATDLGAPGDEIAIEISADAIKDADDEFYAGLLSTDDPNWSFTIDDIPPAPTYFHPISGSANAPLDGSLFIAFDDEPVIGTGNIGIYRVADDSLVENIDVTSVTQNGNRIAITPTVPLDYETSYYVLIDSGSFTDALGNAYAGISDPAAWTFTTISNDPAVLFGDSFNRPNDIDLNASAAKYGSLGALTYTEVLVGVANVQLSDGQLLLESNESAGGSGPVVYPNHNFTDTAISTAGGFSVTVDLNAYLTGGTARYMSVAVGQSSADIDAQTSASASGSAGDLVIGYRGNNSTLLVIANGISTSIASLPATPTTMRIDYALSDFNAGSTVDYEVFFDDSVTPFTSGSFTWSGTDENYISLSANLIVTSTPGERHALFDNLQIRTLASVSGSDFASWQAANSTAGGLDEDHDGDGVSNGVEYFIGGPNGNTTGFTALPSVTNDAETLSVTFTKAADYAGVYGTDFVVETSATLALGSWVNAAEGAGADQVEITGNDVKYTFPAGTKNFARLKVTGP